MSRCPFCAAEVSPEGRFCPACGSPLGASPADSMAVTTPGASSPPSSFSGMGHSRFIPGALIEGRYRIVGMLGRGGMGEVYRADDLKLGQPVALKFLPEGLEHDSAWLERFLTEVRMARQVTHPNVCRVYDVGEVDGQHFLSMEYIDGEDLASLLRRIGRLPEERAIQVSRQICAGLASAHEQGILHRDLKPANIMIDGRGRVRITDFGLAGLAESSAEGEVVGTPAYMPPEIIGGSAATVRSDIYSLGLVLYEVFTGKQAFSGGNLEELRRQHQSTPPSSLSTHVQNLDPAVERVVLRCLEKDPGARPPSALAVAAGLPGGDPLAAALAAGETPSPELLAQAGRSEAMRPGSAMVLALVGLVLFIGGARWAGTQSIMNFLPLDKRPEVLMDRAQETLKDMGYTEPVFADPTQTAWGFFVWSSVLQEVAETDSSATRWERLRARPDAATFWYRQGPGFLVPQAQGGPTLVRGRVQVMNPFPSETGMVSVALDLNGDLRRFEITPKRFSTAMGEEPDWTPLFEGAGLDPERFTETYPGYQRFFAPDLRRAWLGTRPERPWVEYRVDAGAYEGRPVLFNVAPRGGVEALGADPEIQTRDSTWIINQIVVPVSFLLVMSVALLLARRNVRQGRADRRGATRLAVVYSGISVLSLAMNSSMVRTILAFEDMWPILAASTFMGFVVWITYLAAEPLGRQVWPVIFISSSRLLGRTRIEWRDPVIGHSVLVGVIAGTLMSLARPAVRLGQGLIEGAPPRPLGYDMDALGGTAASLGEVTGALQSGIMLTFLILIALVVARFLLRNRWVAAATAVVLLTLLRGTGSMPSLIAALMAATLLMVVLLRWGIVAALVAQIVSFLALTAQCPDWSAWYAQAAVTTLLVTGALTAYGVWAATGGRKQLSLS